MATESKDMLRATPYISQADLRTLIAKLEITADTIIDVETDIEGCRLGREDTLACDEEMPIPATLLWVVVSDRAKSICDTSTAAITTLLDVIATQRIDVIRVNGKPIYQYTPASHDEILPGRLYLGDAKASKLITTFDCMINCTDNLKCWYPTVTHETYIQTGWEDTTTQKLTGLDEYVTTLHKWITAGKRVLVHCQQGQSRSAALVLKYLMTHLPATVDVAHEYLLAKRPMVRPNAGFMAQLRTAV